MRTHNPKKTDFKAPKVNPRWCVFLYTLTFFFAILLGGNTLLTNVVGETIKLQTEPIKQKDIIYGDHVVANYEIENIHLYQLDKHLVKELLSDSNPQIGSQSVYVVLMKNTLGYHSVIKVRKHKPHSGLFIKAQLENKVVDNKAILTLPNNRHYINKTIATKASDVEEVVLVSTFRVYKGHLIFKGVDLKEDQGVR